MCSETITPSIPARSASWAIATSARRSRGETIVQFSDSTRTSRGAGGAAISGEGHAHGQALEAVGEVRAVARGLAGQLDRADAGRQLLQEDPDLEARQVHAQAVVRAAASERQLVCGVSPDVEAMGVRVVVGVAVGGRKPDDDLVAGRDPLAA